MDQCCESIHEVQQMKLDCYILFSLPRRKVRAVFHVGKHESWPQKQKMRTTKQTKAQSKKKKSPSKSKS